MTRRISTLATVPTGKPLPLQALEPVRNLTDQVTARLALEIRSGRLPPSSRLPTEQVLMESLGVSRTVVREAVAALRAEGLVVTRQGSGAFVAADSSRVPFRIDPDAMNSLENVLGVMELRLAIEVESAALAAQRATAGRMAAIGSALNALDRAIEDGEAAVNEDFLFHLAIAGAAANPQFVQFLQFLGRHVIPRQSIRVGLVVPDEQRAYLTRIQKEHVRIAAAVRDRHPQNARAAMRTHLTRSLERYRGLAARLQNP